jgi:pimeloyl-ACP methyl ester carboxylesterase
MTQPLFLQHPVGEGAARRTIAVLKREAQGNPLPPLVWLGGFKSDMRATKAEALDAFAAKTHRALIRFDYSGHGESGGLFEEGTISRWCEEACSVIQHFAPHNPMLIGSSMGAWIALLAARHVRKTAAEHQPSALILIAPAIDFTQKLMWERFSPAIQQDIMDKGVYHRPSPYGPEPYTITRALIEDGRKHLLLDGPIEIGCPVHILQGMLDEDVPYHHALTLMEHLTGDNTTLTLIKDGDHRLSRPQDITLLLRAIENLST